MVASHISNSYHCRHLSIPQFEHEGPIRVHSPCDREVEVPNCLEVLLEYLLKASSYAFARSSIALCVTSEVTALLRLTKRSASWFNGSAPKISNTDTSAFSSRKIRFRISTALSESNRKHQLMVGIPRILRWSDIFPKSYNGFSPSTASTLDPIANATLVFKKPSTTLRASRADCACCIRVCKSTSVPGLEIPSLLLTSSSNFLSLVYVSAIGPLRESPEPMPRTTCGGTAEPSAVEP
jgi:hypothetical protein